MIVDPADIGLGMAFEEFLLQFITSNVQQLIQEIAHLLDLAVSQARGLVPKGCAALLDRCSRMGRRFSGWVLGLFFHVFGWILVGDDARLTGG